MAQQDDRFGHASICGNIAVVGARRDDDNGENSGSAYLFDVVTGQQLWKLFPDDGAAGDNFGGDVSISGNTAIVGARSGSAYLFDVTTGQQIAKLLPNDGESADLFGEKVAVFDNLAIVGASHDDDYGDMSGSAYLFDVTTGQQIAKLLPNDGEEGDTFGLSVDIDENLAVIGADDGNNIGSAYVFDVVTGQQVHKLLPPPSG